MIIAGNSAGAAAAFATALWAIHGRTASLQTFAAAFAIAGVGASVALAMGSTSATILIDWHAAFFLAVLLTTYQFCLWVAFRFGSPLVQAVVNCNVLIIIACDAAATTGLRNVDPTAVAAALTQVAASAFLVLHVSDHKLDRATQSES
jgi:hypothetical protein